MLIRLYLVPEPNRPQRILDVPQEDLILDIDGQYRYAGFAQYAALRDEATGSTEFIRICWRETVDQDDPDYPAPIEVDDPSGGECICLLTCGGVKIPVQTTVVAI